MWQLYVEYGRENADLAVVGAIAAVAARMLGLLPALVLGLAIDAVLLGERPFSLPFVPDSVIPADAAGQL
jgi:ATP-binding cassette subfamily B protein